MIFDLGAGASPPRLLLLQRLRLSALAFRGLRPRTPTMWGLPGPTPREFRGLHPRAPTFFSLVGKEGKSTFKGGGCFDSPSPLKNPLSHNDSSRGLRPLARAATPMLSLHSSSVVPLFCLTEKLQSVSAILPITLSLRTAVKYRSEVKVCAKRKFPSASR